MKNAGGGAPYSASLSAQASCWMWIRFDIFPLVAIRVSASQILIFLYVPDHLLPFLYQTLFTKGVFMKRTFFIEAAYAAGLIAFALGTAFMARADFGMSMVVAPALMIYLKVS